MCSPSSKYPPLPEVSSPSSPCALLQIADANGDGGLDLDEIHRALSVPESPEDAQLLEEAEKLTPAKEEVALELPTLPQVVGCFVYAFDRWW